MRLASSALALIALSAPALAEDLTVGFAIAKSGWMEAYDTPAATAAKIRIDEINASGGFLAARSWLSRPTPAPTGPKVPRRVSTCWIRAPR